MNPEQLKRLAVLVVSVAVIALNKKFGLDLGVGEIASLSAIVIAYLSGSNWKAAALAKAEALGAAAAATVDSPAAAVAAINRGPQP